MGCPQRFQKRRGPEDFLQHFGPRLRALATVLLTEQRLARMTHVTASPLLLRRPSLTDLFLGGEDGLTLVAARELRSGEAPSECSGIASHDAHAVGVHLASRSTPEVAARTAQVVADKGIGQPALAARKALCECADKFSDRGFVAGDAGIASDGGGHSTAVVSVAKGNGTNGVARWPLPLDWTRKPRWRCCRCGQRCHCRHPGGIWRWSS
mmetsp:Transcript_11799/g.31857  ORF Transcript_11799/g.31857 Transcript_11799/m.31857 type:complete len:210 (-) Transcript_11799:12-641(-)